MYLLGHFYFFKLLDILSDNPHTYLRIRNALSTQCNEKKNIVARRLSRTFAARVRAFAGWPAFEIIRGPTVSEYHSISREQRRRSQSVCDPFPVSVVHGTNCEC